MIELCCRSPGRIQSLNAPRVSSTASYHMQNTNRLMNLMQKKKREKLVQKPNQASVMPDDITPRCKWAGSGTQVQAAWRRPLAWPAAGASGGSGMRGRR